MRCLFCGSDQSSVVDKRAVKTSGEIRRRRECLKCHRRYTTYERVSATEIYVIKRSGGREFFDRLKIRAGLVKALEKRPGLEFLDEIVDRIERKVKARGLTEIQTKDIGKAVLQELKKLDKIAYLRFASVYRQFNDPSDFSKELEYLKA